MKEDGQCIFLSDVIVESFVNLQPNNWINVNPIHIRDRKRKVYQHLIKRSFTSKFKTSLKTFIVGL